MEYSASFEEDNAGIRNCKFAFKCEKRWNDLKTISGSDKDIRFCGDCEQKVYRCRTDDQLKFALRKNRCIAIHFRAKGPREEVDFVGLPADALDQDF